MTEFVEELIGLIRSEAEKRLKDDMLNTISSSLCNPCPNYYIALIMYAYLLYCSTKDAVWTDEYIANIHHQIKKL